MFNNKKLYVALGVLGALVILAGTVGVVYAQDPEPPEGHRLFGESRMGSGRVPRDRAMGGFSLVTATAETTGLTNEEVMEALQEGLTFAEIAEAEGVDTQAIIDSFLAQREAELTDAVADGRLTQEQADEMLSEMAEHILEGLDQPHTADDRPMQGLFGRPRLPGTGFSPPLFPNLQVTG